MTMNIDRLRLQDNCLILKAILPSATLRWEAEFACRRDACLYVLRRGKRRIITDVTRRFFALNATYRGITGDELC